MNEGVAGVERHFESQGHKVIVMDYVHNLCAEFDKLEVMPACSIKLRELIETYTNPWHEYAYPSLAFFASLFQGLEK